MVFCLAFPYDLEADMSSGISLITSTQRFVRGHLQVINFVALEENADFATSTKSFGGPLG